MEDIRIIQLSLRQRQLGLIPAQLPAQSRHGPSGRPVWRPSINVYRYHSHIRICTDLAGIDRSTVALLIEPYRVRLQGLRCISGATTGGEPPQQVLALEIDDGPCHRDVLLPVEIVPAAALAEQSNGLLWLHLPLRRNR